jgi:hypothetical protein
MHAFDMIYKLLFSLSAQEWLMKILGYTGSCGAVMGSPPKQNQNSKPKIQKWFWILGFEFWFSGLSGLCFTKFALWGIIQIGVALLKWFLQVVSSIHDRCLMYKKTKNVYMTES